MEPLLIALAALSSASVLNAAVAALYSWRKAVKRRAGWGRRTAPGDAAVGRTRSAESEPVTLTPEQMESVARLVIKQAHAMSVPEEQQALLAAAVLSALQARRAEDAAGTAATPDDTPRNG
jgi:hypothetical protein